MLGPKFIHRLLSAEFSERDLTISLIIENFHVKKEERSFTWNLVDTQK